MHLLAEADIAQKGLTVLGGKHKVYVDLDEGLRHDSPRFVKPLRGIGLRVYRIPACAARRRALGFNAFGVCVAESLRGTEGVRLFYPACAARRRALGFNAFGVCVAESLRGTEGIRLFYPACAARRRALGFNAFGVCVAESLRGTEGIRLFYPACAARRRALGLNAFGVGILFCLSETPHAKTTPRPFGGGRANNACRWWFQRGNSRGGSVGLATSRSGSVRGPRIGPRVAGRWAR